ncbi:MAG: molybdenum cofactor guanylyltransferase [Desulfamplus sp.]|nr:molybdenum cofactor guanylyltransferase [Desulfamplus sp.]
MDNFSAVIVAGGLNTRMGGNNKAFLTLGGKTIISRLISILEMYFDEILLVTKNPEDYSNYTKQVKIITDIYEARSSLTGIHAGIYHAKNFFSFVVPCDAPFIQPPLIKLLLDSITPESDVVIPHHDGYYEPLCAVYSKRCIEQIEYLISLGNYKIYNLFKVINLKTVEKDKLTESDPELISFFNVNTPDSLEAASRLIN